MEHPKVVVTDFPGHSVGPERDVLAEVGATVVDASDMDDSDLARVLERAAGILTCFRHVTADHIRSAPGLKVIGRYGVGVDNIAVGAATERGIPVANVPDYCVDEVADHALALAFSLTRGVTAYDRSVRNGTWELGVAAPLRRTSSLVLGVIGFGRIGQNLANKAAALGFQVHVCDRHAAERASDDQFVRASFVEVLETADVVSLHLPLNASTHHLIGGPELARMKRSAFLINVSRGALVDEGALVDALRRSVIAGAGLDVLEEEPMSLPHPLRNLPNVVVTPHVAYYSEESLVDLQQRAAKNVALVLGGHRPPNVVNGA